MAVAADCAITLYVRAVSGEKISTLQVDGSWTGSTLKEAIETAGVFPSCVCVHHLLCNAEGCEIADGDSVGELGLIDGDDLQVVLGKRPSVVGTWSKRHIDRLSIEEVHSTLVLEPNGSATLKEDPRHTVFGHFDIGFTKLLGSWDLDSRGNISMIITTRRYYARRSPRHFTETSHQSLQAFAVRDGLLVGWTRT
eukprot:TRINITY_DN74467_c0_g1_i1.p1 TRINITY_DN74467_c0_g1~~TRINITY_DN74467_c0_g1_i1.p1  ORF type:complete len:221 (+),score=25.63 TRINITY_DN74467_c0_g1_i1:81-665(+)